MMSIEYHHVQADGLELVLAGDAVRHYPKHIHTRSTVMGTVLQGALELKIADHARLYAAGTRFVIPPRTPHSLTLSRGSLLAVLCVDLERATFRTERRFPLQPQHPLFLPYRKTIREKLLDMLETPSMRTAPQNAMPDKNNLGEIEKMAHSIAAEPAESYPLQAMANQAGCTLWHFLRTFRKTVGVTPHVWQIACRLRQLRQFLRTDTALADAAVSAGFFDQSHMQHLFKRYHGITPVAFRKASFKLTQE
jgi:AraC-like DNA-binding protein